MSRNVTTAPTSAPALFIWVRTTVGVGVVHKRVHIFGKYIFALCVAKETQTGGIAERAIPVHIDSINRFGCGVEQQKVFLFALTKRRLNLLEVGHIDPN